MQDSKFWRTLAIVICGGLIYIGYCLQGPSGNVGSPFVGIAHAGGVAVSPGGNQVFTASADGRTLYVWIHDGAGVHYAGMTRVEDEGAEHGIRGGERRAHEPFWYDARDPGKPHSLQDKEGGEKPSAK